MGTIALDPLNEHDVGAIAMTAIGGMGIVFDGGYAEFVVVARENVIVLRDQGAVERIGWGVLGALPVMMQTAYGCLVRALRVEEGEVVFVRGGTTSVGFAVAGLARGMGVRVWASTRRGDEATRRLLEGVGVERVFVDEGSGLSEKVREVRAEGVDKVLELVGASTLGDSLKCLREGGICCFTGLVGGSHVVEGFNPLMMISTGRCLTAYAERTFSARNWPADEIVEKVAKGKVKVRIGSVFRMSEIVQAHECLERNEAVGKVVVLVDEN